MQPDIQHLIAYILLALVALWLMLFGLFQRHSIIEGLRGKDKVWQFIEIVMILWTFLFPMMVLTEPLGMKYSDNAFEFMEIIFAAAVAGKVGLKYSENKYKKDE
jgi:hypothetical protein